MKIRGHLKKSWNEQLHWHGLASSFNVVRTVLHAPNLNLLACRVHEFHFTEARSILFLRRRTADVRTVGYVECFVLAKEDVLSAIRDYPEAQVKNTEVVIG